MMIEPVLACSACEVSSEVCADKLLQELEVLPSGSRCYVSGTRRWLHMDFTNFVLQMMSMENPCCWCCRNNCA